MTHAPIFAANWKLNLGPAEARAYMQRFLEAFAPASDRTVAFFPPALTLHAVVDALAARRDILVGVQNVHSEPSGAFTGENSAVIAHAAGASLALVGHSERRHVFGESDEAAGQKCAAAVRAGLRPVLCVGETLAEREAGATERVVLRQLAAGLAALGADEAAGIWLAYEPVWAIGTGRTATPDDAAAIHAVLRAALTERLGARAAGVPILYGGSVNTGNVAALLAASDVNGVLVGGASLDPDGWARIALT